MYSRLANTIKRISEENLFLKRQTKNVAEDITRSLGAKFEEELFRLKIDLTESIQTPRLIPEPVVISKTGDRVSELWD
jgi:hypothetical protein